MKNSFSYPCVVIDVLADVWVGEVMNMFRVEVLRIGVCDDVVIGELIVIIMIGADANMLADVDIIVMTAAVIDLEFSISVSYAAVVLADAVVDGLTGGVIGDVTAVGVEVFTCVNANICEAVKTDLKFILTTPSVENFVPFCGALLSC